MNLQRPGNPKIGFKLPKSKVEPAAAYNPSIIEWTITLGSFAALILGFTLFVKFFPIVPIWEMEEEEEKQVAIQRALAEISMKKKRKFVEPGPEIA